MFFNTFRLFAPVALTLAATLSLSACGGGGGGGGDATPSTLEVVKTGGGSGTVAGGGINCGSVCSVNSQQGATITLTATPGSGQVFDGWSGDAAGCGSASSCSITLGAARVVARASFSVAASTTVSVTLGGNSMGTVTSSPSGISCPSDCTETYPRSGMVTLTATPANANNVFVNWTGDAAGCGTSRTCSLMLSSAAINATANFQPVGRSLAVSTTGTGTVTSSPAGINCGSDCGETYQQGTMVTLTPTAGTGATFTGWGGACTGTGSCVVTMDADKSVTATFANNNVTLSISRIGAGTITSNPAGINCGMDCSEVYARNASVTLTATADASATFQGWSGGGCSGNGATCTPTLTGDTTVTASFSGQAGQGELYGLTNAGRIVSFDRATPGSFRTAATITGLNSGEVVGIIDTRPVDGKIYGLTNASRLVTIDLVSGAATVRSTLAADPADNTAPFTGLEGTVFGMDFNPTVDRLRIVSNNGQNLRVNVDTGAVTTDAPLNPGMPAALDAAYTFNFNGSTGTSLFVIDSATDKLYLQSPPNDGTLTEVGALGVDVAQRGGFEIIGSNVDAFASLRVGSTSSLYRIDLRSGAATKVGDFASGENVVSLAAAIAATPASAGDLAVLTSSGKVVTVNRAAASAIRTSALITGLTAGDTPLDIDYRPDATRALYLLARDSGSGASLYIVDPVTGAASNRVALTADTADTSSPYAGLTGSNFGIDFQIATTTTATAAGSDRLRVVSDNGQNLLVNVADGKVTTATNVPSSSTLVSAAYTNAFLQSGFTTLYTINSNGNTLNRQDGDNGTQTSVGALGLTTVAAPVGFDINGANNEGLLSLNDAGTAKLYSVNLTTGAVANTSGETLGSGEAVKAVALKPQNEPQIFGITSAGALVRFTTATIAQTNPTYSVVGTVTYPAGTTGVSLLGMDFRPRTGDLVALGSNAKLYLINTTTAAATELSTLAPDAADTDGSPAFATTMIATANQYAVDFNPVVDRLRIVGSNNINLRVNVDTGAVTTDTNVGRPPFAITGIGFSGATTPVLYGLDSASDRLFTVDTATNTQQGNPGRLTQVGDLGVDIGAVNGFDVRGTTEAFAVSKDAGGALQLYSVNLTTGKATVRGNGVPLSTCNGGSTGTDVRAFAASTLTTNLFAIHNGGCLVEFDKDTPSPQIASRAITNIPSNETVIGMDFLAGTGGTSETLYVVTKVGTADTGKLYTVNTSTGAATAVTGTPTGIPPAAATTFALPAGATAYGVDHNRSSTSPALRITANTETGNNIEVNTSTLAVSNLSTLNQTTPLISSEAYINDFAGATSTKLYALDTGNDSLMTQGKATPNDGQLFDVRALNIAVANTGGFDVIGGDNGYGIAVLQSGTDAFSSLFRVDLSGTGNVLTSIGAIGNTATNTTSPRLVINGIATRFTP